MENDTQQLVERIIRDAKIPKGSSYRDPVVLLGMADAETRSLVLQHLMRASGDYLVRYLDVPLVPGRRAYRLPPRAIRLKEVERYGEDGVQRDFSSIDSAQARAHQGSGAHWYFEDNAVVPLLEAGASGGFLRMRYYRWPSRLILPTPFLVTSWGEGSGDWELTAQDDDATAVASLSDIIKTSSPFETVADDLPTAEVEHTGSLVVHALPLPMPEGLEVGDILVPAGTSCFPQLPLAFHDVLVTHVVARVLRETKDMAGSAAAREEAGAKGDAALVTASPRSKSERPIVSKKWF